MTFGPFRLNLGERLLERSGVPVSLGARALEILSVLSRRQGEVVEKKELIALVWPGVNVDEGSLRFHMNGLRKALGDGKEGARFIATIPGRGYCFVAPVVRVEGSRRPNERGDAPGDQASLPPPLGRMIGREACVDEITAALLAKRFVTIVGPGGIGKTTVAIAVAHKLMPAFVNGVRFVDLASTTDGKLVPTMIASAVGLVAHTSNIIPNLIGFLSDKSLLIILDSCEHVVDDVARAAEAIFAGTPDVHILATSREALRIDGEQVSQLAPLPIPPVQGKLDREALLGFPAVQLFIERVKSSGIAFEMSEFDAPDVARICRNLDGIPLALELAAGRVGAYGIGGIAALLGDRFALLGNSRRTANPRHQTLSTALDWSYNLLGDQERSLLRRLSIFTGAFTLHAAVAVAAFGDQNEISVMDGIGNLISKSLVSSDLARRTPRYRLLDTTRAYIREKLIESGEGRDVARRHALHYLEVLDGESRSSAASDGRGDTQARDDLGNIRVALAWSLSDDGDPEVGTSLAAAAGPLLVDLSLLSECCTWASRGIDALNESTRGTLREINLQAALGHSLMFTEGNSERVRECFRRGVELARKLDQPLTELRLLGGLHLYHERTGNYRGAVEFAERSEVVAQGIGHPAALAAAGSFLGLSQHLVGNHEAARALLRKALASDASPQASAIHFGFDYRNRSRITLARHHWLVGEVDQACELAEQTIADATKLHHPVTICIALIWGITVALWTGDAEGSERKIDDFVAHAKKHSLNPYSAVGTGYKGELCVLRGDGHTGVKLLTEALEALHGARYELVTTTLMISLAQGLAQNGEWEEAERTIEETLHLVETNGDLLYMPEVLRTKASILARDGAGDLVRAERNFLLALDCAGRQSALSWELRTATSFAAMRRAEGRLDEAREILEPVYARFTEGFGTRDLVESKALLGRLAAPPEAVREAV
jgi:predicted ATPase/DNA-binding winged helix-turn-helix (wHTH) protein